EDAIVVQIDFAPDVQNLWILDLLFGELAVMIGVEALQHVFEGRKVLLLACVGAAGPVLDVDDVRAENGRGLQLPGQAADPPDRFTGLDGVGGQLIASGHQRLRFAARRRPDYRRGKASRELGALDTPDLLAGVLVHCQKERVRLAIQVEQQRVSNQYR